MNNKPSLITAAILTMALAHGSAVTPCGYEKRSARFGRPLTKKQKQLAARKGGKKRK